MAQHLDSRCVLLLDPTTLGAGFQRSQRSQPKHVSNSDSGIKKCKPHFIYTIGVHFRYSDGTFQVVNYRTLPAFHAHLQTYGKFQATNAYFSAPDPFQRSPSVMPFDRELQAYDTFGMQRGNHKL